MSTNNDLFDKARYWASCRLLRAPLGMYAVVWAVLVVLALVIDQAIDLSTILGAFLLAFIGIQVGYRVVYLRMIKGGISNAPTRLSVTQRLLHAWEGIPISLAVTTHPSQNRRTTRRSRVNKSL